MLRTSHSALLVVVIAALGCNAGGPEPAVSTALMVAVDHAPLAVGGPASARLTPRFDAKENAFLVGQDLQPGATPSANLYEARVDARTGVVRVKRHDAQAGLTLRPVAGLLPAGAATAHAGSLVFPVDADAAIVQTPQRRGVKEDIVLRRARGDQLTLEWQLDLDPGLEARLDDHGNVNVYGPGNYLWGDVQAADDRTRDLVQKARQLAKKDQLLYRIPAPVVRQATGATAAGTARFTLEGARLRLLARGLQALAYPISIDPTVLVTNTTDFAYPGNFDGSVDLGNNLIKRARPTYGAASWTLNATKLPTARRGHCSVAYNGKLYVIGGYDGSSFLNEVRVAPITGTTVGSFAATTALPSGRQDAGCAVFNGYLYVVGGWSSAVLPDVLVAKINPDGTLASSWTPTTALATARSRAGVVAFNGFLYVAGGFAGVAARRQDVLFAPLRGDGTVGSWTTIANPLPGPRENPTMVAYNRALYVLGGSDGSTYRAEVYLSRLGLDGTPSAWVPTTSFSGARYSHASLVHDGYVYVIGGSGATLYDDVQVAPVNADGTVGPWRVTASFGGGGRQMFGAAAYAGALYLTGGLGSTAIDDQVLVGRVDATDNANGGVGDWRASLNKFTTERYQHATVAANGFLYVLGGYNGTALGDVQYAPVSADGSVGVWKSANSMLSARRAPAAVAYEGYLYVTGGQDNTLAYRSDGEVAKLNDDGTLGTWGSLASTFTTGRSEHGSVAYNGYLYVIGGGGSSGFVNDVRYAPITGAGTIGAWNTLANAFSSLLGSGRKNFGVATYNGFIYVTGGQVSSGYTALAVKSRLNSDGTPTVFSSAASDLPSARGYHTTVVHHGYLYAIGGYTGSAYLPDVLAAPILLNGNLGAWVATTPLPSARRGLASAVLNGIVYTTGGVESTYQGDVRYALLNANGMVAGWSATGSFATARAQHATVAANGYLYVIGGYDPGGGGTYMADVQYAPIKGDGTVNGWQTNTFNLPTGGRWGHAAAASATHLYVLGGTMSSGSTAEVWYASLNANGSTGSWVAGTVLPTARVGLDASVYNGRLYVTGGRDTADLAFVHYTTLNASTGAPGASWALGGTFATARYSHRSVIHNGYLYVVGGRAGSVRLTSVEFAPVLASGGLGAFASTAPLLGGRSTPGLAAYGGYLYVFGGLGTTGYLGDTQVAPIASDGTLGQWSYTSTFTNPRSGAGSAAVDGTLYLTGGYTAAPIISSDVQMATLLTPTPRGTYSWVKDFGRTMTSVDSLVVNSAVGGGALKLGYRVAGPTGIFGPLQIADVVPGTSIPLGDTLVQYLWIGLSLDDTDTAVAVAPAAGNERDVTDFAVTYTDRCDGVTCNGPCQGPCNPVTGSCVPVSGSCDDGNPCTKGDTCSAGTCSGTPYTCNDGLICTDDVCDGNGSCTYPVQTGRCLIGGTCYTSGATNGMCRECQPTTSQTAWTYVTGKACNDGITCTATDICTAGGSDDSACHGTLAANSCLIAGVCYSTGATNGTCRECQPSSSTSAWTYMTNKACDDNVSCTHTDVCTAGGSDDSACHGQSYSCDDGKTCTTDACKGDGTCDNTIQAGFCLIGGTCYANGAAHPTNQCQVCASATPTAWSNRPDDTGCTDSNQCTRTDLCKGGVCTGTNQVVCTAQDECHVAGVCAPATGACTNPIQNNGTQCSDGKSCTTGDNCQAGVCTPTANNCTCTKDEDCPALNDCYFDGTCNLGTGLCSYSFKTGGTPCDDGDACTTGETCASGVCGAPTATVTCTALDQCHEAGTCDSDTGLCSDPELPDYTACDDNRSCTSGDACQAGVCRPTTNDCVCTGVSDCPALGQCTLAGTCDSGSCVNAPLDDGTPCDDGNSCTEGDQCVAGVCTGATSLCEDGGVDAGADGGAPGDAAPDGAAPGDAGADAATADAAAGDDAAVPPDGATSDGPVTQEVKSYLGCSLAAAGVASGAGSFGLLLVMLGAAGLGRCRRRR